MTTTPPGSAPADDARAMLDALATDSDRLASRAVAPAPWYYPALAAAAAAMVWAPALGDGGGSIALLGLAALAFASIASAHRKQTGVSVRIAAAPWTLALAVAVSVVVGGLLVSSFVLASREAHGQILWAPGVAFLVMLVGSVAADRLHRAELRRAR